jgi:hypothetical protein
LAVLCLALATAGRTGSPPRDWHSVATPRFEIVSRQDAAVVAPLLVELERARLVFELHLGFKARLDRSALILIADSASEYEKIRPLKFSAGYYYRAPWRDFIVLRSLKNARHTVLHEYTHLVFFHQGGKWTLWYREGIAEYFGSMRRTTKGVAIGDLLVNHMGLLARMGWLAPSELFALEKVESLGSSDEFSRFYAQSWLYTHMLQLSPSYRDRSTLFRVLLAQGVKAEEALKRIYGISPVEFERDARRWFEQKAFPVLHLEGDLEIQVHPQMRPVTELEAELAKATITAAWRPPAESGADYRNFASLAGDGCEYQAPLGDLAFAANLFGEVSSRYQRAIQCGADPAGLAVGLESALLRLGEAGPTEVEAVLQLTGGARSRYLLGAARFFRDDYAGALEALTGLGGLSPEEEFRATRMRALALAGLERHAEARQEASRLAALARDDFERASAELTLADVERAASTPSPSAAMEEGILKRLTRLDGVVIRVDCLGAQARFWVQAGEEIKKLIVIDPSEVVGGGKAGEALEFACGAQQRPVTIGYVEQADPEWETTGRIRYIRFR